MPNTGQKVYQWLVQINTATGLPTGLRKPNDPADADYVAPVTDAVSCPNVPPPTFIWIEDSITCEQDSIFELVADLTGFSSPQGVYYDETSGRMYIVDIDDPNGNIYHFDPGTITSFADIVYVPGIVEWLYGHAFDPVLRRIFVIGKDTGGLMVLNLSDHSVVTVPYGTDASFSRLLLKLLGDTLYCGNSAGGNTLTLINKNTLTISSVLDIDGGDIPSGTTYLTDAYQMTFVNGSELWVTANQRANGDIAVYNEALDTLITTIPVAGATISGWGGGRYWQSSFYDAINGKFYICDTGSSKIFIYDTTTRALVHTISINNRAGKLYAATGISQNPLTGELFVGYIGQDSPSDSSQELRTYKLNSTTYEFENVLPGVFFGQLTNQTGTGVFFGANQGTVAWSGSPTWQTDGRLLKFMQ